MDLFEPLSDHELGVLDSFLLELEPDDSIFCVSELDGFLTAIVVGPDMIPPSEWLQVVWGGDGTGPEWESVDDFQNTYQLIIRLMNSIAMILKEQPENFEALFMQREVEGKTYQIVDEWCHGFFRAVSLRADRWDEMSEAARFLAPIGLFAFPDTSDRIEQMSDEDIQACQDLIEPAVHEIYRFWLQRRDTNSISPVSDEMFPTVINEPFRRAGGKIGRNDSCPCGSGKKYKRCCALH